jgi:hypothetical protein
MDLSGKPTPAGAFPERSIVFFNPSKTSEHAMTGTLVNAVAIIAGGVVGLLLKKGIKDRYKRPSCRPSVSASF